MQYAKLLSPEETVSALLFGAAGFLEPHPIMNYFTGEVAEFTHKLIRFWQHARHVLQIKPMQRSQWQFFRLRPQNFPTRRIAGVAGLVAKFQRLGILEFLLHDIKNKHIPHQEINRSLCQFFTIETDEFWRYHYDFKMRKERAATGNLGMLIGKQRAADLVINIVFPLIVFYAEETGDGTLQNKILELYNCHPQLQENSVTRQMRKKIELDKRQLTGASYNVCLQQGLLHLAHNLCADGMCRQCLDVMQPSASREAEN